MFRSVRLSSDINVHDFKINHHPPWIRLFDLDAVPSHPGYRLTTSWLHYTTSCNTQSSALRMGEIIARNMLSWLELLINGYCCI